MRTLGKASPHCAPEFFKSSSPPYGGCQGLPGLLVKVSVLWLPPQTVCEEGGGGGVGHCLQHQLTLRAEQVTHRRDWQIPAVSCWLPPAGPSFPRRLLEDFSNKVGVCSAVWRHCCPAEARLDVPLIPQGNLLALCCLQISSCRMWGFSLVVSSLIPDTGTCGGCRTSGDNAGRRPRQQQGGRQGPTCVTP